VTQQNVVQMRKAVLNGPKKHPGANSIEGKKKKNRNELKKKQT